MIKHQTTCQKKQQEARLGHDGLVDEAVARVVHAFAQRHVGAEVDAARVAHIVERPCAREEVTVLMERHLQPCS